MLVNVLDLSGAARERGRAHGEELRGQIERGVGLWKEHAGNAVEHRATPYLRAVARWTPAVVEEVRGIAEGAGQPFETMLAFNLADELRVFAPRGCSSIGLRSAPPASGQTMDTPAWFAETRVCYGSASRSPA